VSWAHFNKRIQSVTQKERFATAQEIQATFDAEREDLFWLAFIITGDSAAAQKVIVDASGLQRTASTIFRDWLSRWAHSATAREATRNVHQIASVSARSYSEWSCAHGEHELLAEEQQVLLRQIEPLEVIKSLDPLARSVLILRGIQNASVSDCTILLSVSRRAVMGAYCHALTWFKNYTTSQRHDNAETTKAVPDIGEVAQ
jgi:DNA-directed RNA polymerase specialized sigma24 family protein